MGNINPVLIQYFYSATDVGYFFAAIRVVGVLGLITNALGTLLFPALSELHASGEEKKMKKLVTQSERYLGMIGLPLAFCTVALANPIVKVALSGWMPTAIILQVLAFYVLFIAIEQPYSGQLLGANKPKVIRDKLIITFSIDMVLNFILIPKNLFGIPMVGLGGLGAAIALAVAYGAGWFYCRTVAQIVLPGTGANKHLIKHLSAAIIMAIGVYYAIGFIPMMRWFWLIILAIIYFVGYLGIIVLLREFKKEDLKFILNALNIKQIYRYAKDEVKEK
jgi:O-antigen/teichoic acid export membrane protein